MILRGERMGNPSVQCLRLGGLVREETIKQCERLEALLCEEASRADINTAYDLSYNGKPGDLRYTEIFAALGGLYIAPCDLRAALAVLDRAIAQRCEAVDYRQVFSQQVQAAGRLDKYLLHAYDCSAAERLVLLPGSNLLEQAVDKRLLNQAVSRGAYVKPHPLTSQAHMHRLKNEYGSRVLPRRYSGFKAMAEAKVVYATGTTELALYALLLGKNVKVISTQDIYGGYGCIFEKVMSTTDPARYLNYLLNSERSGIVLPGQEDRIVDYLAYHQSSFGAHER